MTPQARAQLLAEAQAGEARGIGLGSQLSQLVQLAQLSAIDHYAKEERRVPVYQRYMDDFNAMDESRERLAETVDGIVERLHGLGVGTEPEIADDTAAQRLHLLKMAFHTDAHRQGDFAGGAWRGSRGKAPPAAHDEAGACGQGQP